MEEITESTAYSTKRNMDVETPHLLTLADLLSDVLPHVRLLMTRYRHRDTACMG
ncbi:Uncharacterised protein [Vibrio cholerae]|nr:Uncharacterised protein [Vibrio cholerae]